MAVIGGLANMLHRERDKQTMVAIVAGAFLISFLINVRQEPIIALQIACINKNPRRFTPRGDSPKISAMCRNRRSQTPATILRITPLHCGWKILIMKSSTCFPSDRGSLRRDSSWKASKMQSVPSPLPA